MNVALAGRTAFVRAIENRQVLFFQMRSAFNSHGSADVYVGFFNLFIGESECFQQVPAKVVVSFGFKSEAIQTFFSERKYIEHKSDLEGAAHGRIQFFYLLWKEAFGDRKSVV